METTSLYAMRLEEVAWGASLIAATMVMHGIGMLTTLRATTALKMRVEGSQSLVLASGPLILGAWMITLVHLVEVGAWAGFFHWKALLPNASICYAFALMTYTTLGSEYYLPLDWRLLQGMLAMVGLMTFAWSTGVLLTLADGFQKRQIALWSRGKGTDAAK
jgi:hypothetical protein